MTGVRDRFDGHIAGIGTTSGLRVVIGHWERSPFGAFTDVMLQEADGARTLIAPQARIADYVAATYRFDRIDIVPVAATLVGRSVAAGPGDGTDTTGAETRHAGPTPEGDEVSDRDDDERNDVDADEPGDPDAGEGGDDDAVDGHLTARLTVEAGPLRLVLAVGSRTGWGRLLRLVPGPLAVAPPWLRLIDPVASRLVRGVHTAGTAGADRREFYGVRDLHHVTAVVGEHRGEDVGDLAPLDPPVTFGFSSAPSAPSLARVTTTILR